MPPLSLITCLITVSCRRDVVVGDRAGLGLAERDRAASSRPRASSRSRRARPRRRCRRRRRRSRRARATRRPGTTVGFVPRSSTVIVKSAAAWVPPLSLTTCLITISFGAMSSLVIVQVLVSPSAIVPAQSAEQRLRVAGGPALDRRCRRRRSTVTSVPGASAPGNEAGFVPVSSHRHREVAGDRRAAVVVDDVLDHDQLRRDVVVGDRAGLGLADRDRAGAVGRVARRVAGRARLGDVVGAGVDASLSCPGPRHRRTRLGVVPASVDRHREVAGRRGAAVVVDDVLDHDQLRRDVVVGDRAGLGLADRDRAGAVGRVASPCSRRAVLGRPCRRRRRA